MPPMRRFLTIALLVAPLILAPGASGQGMGAPPTVPSFGGGTFTPGFAQPMVTPGFAQPIGGPSSVTSLGRAGLGGDRGLSVPGSIGFGRNPQFRAGMVGSSSHRFHHRHFVPVFVPFYPYVPYTQQVIYQPVEANAGEEDRYAREDREPDRPPARSLLIELHGDRYERRYLGNEDSDLHPDYSGDSPEQRRHRRYAGRREEDREAERFRGRRERERAQEAEAGAAKPVERSATVLILRNGSRLEVHDYAVVGGTLFELSEDRTQTVRISELDLPATIRENRERGLDFRLPAPADLRPVIKRP